MCDKSSVTISVKIDFPQEVDLRGVESKEYNIWDLSDFHECMFDYNRIKMRNGYLTLSDRDFRWIFFLDTYEEYKFDDREDLVLNSVFSQAWYKNKYMTIILLDKNFKFHKRVIPASKED